MELNGEEKTIRALFRELKLEDERATPALVLERKRKASSPVVAFSVGRVVFAVALVCLILVSALLLQRHYFGAQPVKRDVVARQPEMHGSPEKEQLLGQDGVSPVRNETRKPVNQAPRHRRMNRGSQNGRVASSLLRRKDENSFVFDWKSPTGVFLRSPGDELLKSLPQLNQSTLKLGSFLNSSLN